MQSRSFIDARRFITLGLVALGQLGWLTAPANAESPKKVTYQQHVRPIFQEHCFACHSQDGKKSDLALDRYGDAMIGGVGGEVLAAGDASGSRLWMLVTHEESPNMPPGQDKLPQEQLAVIEAWINGGLLADANSKRKKSASPLAGELQPTADNRPRGEPAMPAGVLQQPLVATDSPTSIGALAASPWAPVAAVGGPRQVSLYHTESGKLLGILPFPEGTPKTIRFSRDGSLLVVGGGQAAKSGLVALFDVKSGARIATLGEENDAVLAADISADHQLVALGGPKKVVRVYRVDDGSLAYEIKKHTDWITALEFSPDSQQLATADRSGAVWLWQAAAGLEVAGLVGHKERVADISWRADSQVLATASEDDSLRLWQPTGKQIKSWQPHGGGPHAGVLSVDFARDGRLASTGRDAQIKLWKGDGKGIKQLDPVQEIGLSVCFTHDGQSVVAGDWNGNAPLLSIETGKSVTNLPPNPPLLQTRIASASEQLKQVEKQLAELNENLKQRQQALQTTLAARESRQKQQQASERELATLKEQQAQRQQELKKAMAVCQAADATLATATDRRQKADEQIVALGEQEATPDDAKDKDESAPDPAKLKQAEGELQAALAAIAEAEDKLAEANQQRANREKALATVDAAANAAEGKLQELTASIEKLPQIDPLQNAVAELVQRRNQTVEELAKTSLAHTQAVQALRAVETAASRLEEAARQTAQAGENLAEEQARLAAAKQSAAEKSKSLDEQAKTLEQELATLEEKQRTVQTERRQAKQAYEEQQAQLEATEEQIRETQRRAMLIESQRKALESAEQVREEYATAGS